MAQKRSFSSDELAGPGASLTAEAPLYKSSPIEDRSSTFVAIFSPTQSAKMLQAHADFKSASHRMAAWRKPSAQRTLGTMAKSVMITGSDDDGEKYGGKRIEKVLDETGVEGSLVVARWYGGVLLGPVRFTHIENVAREAVKLWKHSVADIGAKKRRLDADAISDTAEKGRLEKQLIERDQSIVVLRELLAEKTSTTKKDVNLKQSEESSQVLGPAKKPDYTAMPLQRLKQIDKARDATIAWILKQIDAAEACLAEGPVPSHADNSET